jgi:hypothetical protein
MGSVKALLVGVCEYPATGYVSLPLCKNDLFAVRTALINGLNVKPKDIYCVENMVQYHRKNCCINCSRPVKSNQ